MGKNYLQRVYETLKRTPSENISLYHQRRSQGKPTGILERYLYDHAKSGHSGSSDSEPDSCAGSRMGY